MARLLHRQGLTALLLAGAALLLAGCGDRSGAPVVVGPDGKPLTRVTVQFDWYAQPEHGGFFQALVKGYYREAGLDVVLEQGGPNLNPVQKVALGNAEFGIGRSDDLMVAAGRGIPVVMVGAFMQRDPQALMVHEESGIRSFRDLDGRAVMTVPGANFIPLMEKKYGISVSIIPLDFGLSRFVADPGFVQQCFITSEPYYVRQKGAHPRILLLTDMGYAPYRVWFTSKEVIAQQPAVVRAFGAASVRGWREYLDGDRAAADALIQSLNRQITPELTAFSVGAMREFKLVAGDPAAGEAVGRLDPVRVQTNLDQLHQLKLIGTPLKLADVFDDRFLPEETRAKPPPH
jgi:NitT/TauT family transport system substrate-binding protein